jgi:hypothetical protein
MKHEDNPNNHSALDACAILIPALNEEDSVGQVIEAIYQHHHGEVIVIADRCEDATVEVARQYGATVIDLPIRLGAWGAIQTGMRYALSRGYTCVATMDADGQHNPADLCRLLDPISFDASDVSIGACTSRGSRARRIAWHYLRGISALRLRDITSGFRGYNIRAMRLLTSPSAMLLDYQDVGVLLMLINHQLRICEVEVWMDTRKSGHSRIFHSWLAVAHYMYHTSILSLSKVFCRPASPPR